MKPPDERRKARRARIPGMRVIFEGAAGERLEADVLDVASGGLFIRTAKPLAVGKRLSLEIQAIAGLAAWSALGRVIWTREAGTLEAAPGMAVKLIDVEDAVVAALDLFVEARGPTQPGIGAGHAPSRERTVLGLGVPQEPPSEDSDVPDPHEAPTKETVVPHRGVPSVAVVPAVPEPSIPIDLVARKPEDEASLTPAGVPHPGRGGRWLRSFLLVIALAAAALYVMRDRFPWVQRFVETWTASAPAPGPVAAPPSAPTATAVPMPTTAASPAASRATSATATPSRVPSASPTPSKTPARAAPFASPATVPTKSPPGDNPY